MSKSVCGFFKENCLGLQKFLPLTQSMQVFAARNYRELSSWHWKLGLWVGALFLATEISLPNFYPPHTGVGPDCFISLPLLPV